MSINLLKNISILSFLRKNQLYLVYNTPNTPLPPLNNVQTEGVFL